MTPAYHSRLLGWETQNAANDFDILSLRYRESACKAKQALEEICRSLKDCDDCSDRAFAFESAEAHELLRNHAAMFRQTAEDLPPGTRAFDSMEYVPGAGRLPRIVANTLDYLASAGRGFVEQEWLAHLRRCEESRLYSFPELAHLKSTLTVCALLPLSLCLGGAAGKGKAVTSALVQSIASSIAEINKLDVEAVTTELLEFERPLAEDPAGIYGIMDDESKRQYREAAWSLSLAWGVPATELCEAALLLSQGHAVPDDSRMRLKCHVGYYLLDSGGIARLRWYLRDKDIKHRGSTAADLKLRLATAVQSMTSRRRFLTLLEFYALLTCGFAIAPVAYSLKHLPALAAIPCSLAFMILSVSSARVVLFMAIQHLLPSSRLPRISPTSSVFASHAIIVAVPTLLLSADHVRRLIERLAKHYDTLSISNVFVVLLTDPIDCDKAPSISSCALLFDLCARLLGELNDSPRYRERQPFFLLHRDLVYSHSERKWIGWERKRGKIADLATYLATGNNRFSASVGDLERLRHAEYIVVLDDDSRPIPGAIESLASSHMHPLNHPHLDVARNQITRGYGILAPTLTFDSHGKKAEDAARLSHIGRNPLQDALGECGFFGKGSIKADIYQHALQDIPEGCVLSHDTVECGFLRCGSVTDVVIKEPPPTSHDSWCKRRHRWIRGDWQNVHFLLHRAGSTARAMSPFGKILIAENMMQHGIFPASVALLLLYGALARDWKTLAYALLIVFLPIYVEVSLLVAKGIRARGHGLVPGVYHWLLACSWGALDFVGRIAHDAAISMDAIVRALTRLVRGRTLLEWEAAAEAELQSGGPRPFRLCRAYAWIVLFLALLLASLGSVIWHGNVVLLALCILWGKNCVDLLLARKLR